MKVQAGRRFLRKRCRGSTRVLSARTPNCRPQPIALNESPPRGYPCALGRRESVSNPKVKRHDVALKKRVEVNPPRINSG